MIPVVDFPNIAATTPCLVRKLSGGDYVASFRRTTFRYTFTIVVGKSTTNNAVSRLVELLMPDQVPSQIETAYEGMVVRSFGEIYEPVDRPEYLCVDISAEITLDTSE